MDDWNSVSDDTSPEYDHEERQIDEMPAEEPAGMQGLTSDLAAAIKRRHGRQQGQPMEEEEPQVIAFVMPDNDISGAGERLEQPAPVSERGAPGRAFEQEPEEDEIIEAPRRVPQRRAAWAPAKRRGISSSSVAILVLSLAVIGLSVFTGLSMFHIVNFNNFSGSAIIPTSGQASGQAQATDVVANADASATALTTLAQVALTPTTNAVTTFPAILSVSRFLPAQQQEITISGKGFGEQSPYTNATSPYLRIEDITNGDWVAGWNSDAVRVSLSVWNDSQIVITGFSGSYGANGWVFNAGDNVVISVWNVQTGAGGTGTAQFSKVVGS